MYKNERKKFGPPPKVFKQDQRDYVETLAGLGLKVEDIATLVKIPIATLTRRFKEELHNGVVKAKIAITKSAYQSALAGNTTMQIFFLKVRCGWREKEYIEHSGPNDTPLFPAPVIRLNYDKFTAEQIDAQLVRTERLILGLEQKNKEPGQSK